MRVKGLCPSVHPSVPMNARQLQTTSYLAPNLEVNELDGSGLDHGSHGVHQVVHQGVDSVFLVEGDRSHRLLPHGALVRVPYLMKILWKWPHIKGTVSEFT